MMNVFPSEITDQKENISEVHFIKETQSNIDTRYNAASIKVDLTYNSTGSVKGWLEVDSKDNTKYILYVASTDTIYLNTGYQLFSKWKNVKTIDFANINTSNVTTMYGMFEDCSSLDNLNLSNFDTSKVTDMSAMFDFCSSLGSLDLSNFDTSKVTDMDCMFQYCTSLVNLDLSNFDTTSLTNMNSMFAGGTTKPTKFKWVNVETSILRIIDDNMSLSALKNNTFNLVANLKRNSNEKSDGDIVGTGDIATFDSKEYSVVVMGDVDGNGFLNLTDIMKVAVHVYTDNKLSGYYETASDYDKDGENTLTDIMKIARKVYS